MVTQIAFKIIIKVAKIRTTYVQCVVRNELNHGLTFSFHYFEYNLLKFHLFYIPFKQYHPEYKGIMSS